MAPWPLPQQFEQGSSTLWLSPDVQYVYGSVQIATSDFEKFWEKQKVQQFVSSKIREFSSFNSPNVDFSGLNGRTQQGQVPS